MLAALALQCWLFATGPFALGATAIPPAPERFVTDPSGFLSASVRTGLDTELQAYERRTGHQIVVWIGTTTGGVPIEDFAVRAFQQWRVGRAHLDDGVAVFVFATDRRMRIEVGYGLESVITDASASRIIRDVAAPKIAAGDRDGAITGTVHQLMRLADTGSTMPAPRTRLPIVPIVFGIFLLIGFGVLFAVNPSLAMFILWTVLTGGRRSGRDGDGGGSGGGGFAGGGGRSGGGGASGSW